MGSAGIRVSIVCEWPNTAMVAALHCTELYGTTSTVVQHCTSNVDIGLSLYTVFYQH